MDQHEPLVLDVETTTLEKGNPYVKANRLCYVGVFNGEMVNIATKDYLPIKDKLIVGINLKFDLTYLKRYGIDYSTCSIWDCQLAHFLLSGQTVSYPSLNQVANHYGLGSKLDTVASEYWDKGIDTPDIPVEIITDYLKQDLKLTWEVYEKQVEDFKDKPQLFKLFQLLCEDLLVLQEMEWNGLRLDVEQCEELGNQTEQHIQGIDGQLAAFVGDVPINFNSGDHLSCLLYGGTIAHESKVPVGVFKSGAKQGQTRYKKVVYKFPMPQLVKPNKGSELQKEGFYSTDEDTLRTVKANKKGKQLIELLLERSKAEKLLGTYYRGWPKHVSDLDGRVHGQLNQCVVRTGRLSASKPNQQNIDGTFKKMIITRYT